MLQPGVRIPKDIVARLQWLSSSSHHPSRQPNYAVLFGLREECIGRGLILHVKGFVPFPRFNQELVSLLTKMLNYQGLTILGFYVSPTASNDVPTDAIASHYFDLFQSALLKVITASFIGRHPDYDAKHVMQQIAQEACAFFHDLIAIVGTCDEGKQYPEEPWKQFEPKGLSSHTSTSTTTTQPASLPSQEKALSLDDVQQLDQIFVYFSHPSATSIYHKLCSLHLLEHSTTDPIETRVLKELTMSVWGDDDAEATPDMMMMMMAGAGGFMDGSGNKKLRPRRSLGGEGTGLGLSAGMGGSWAGGSSVLPGSSGSGAEGGLSTSTGSGGALGVHDDPDGVGVGTYTEGEDKDLTQKAADEGDSIMLKSSLGHRKIKVSLSVDTRIMGGQAADYIRHYCFHEHNLYHGSEFDEAVVVMDAPALGDKENEEQVLAEMRKRHQERIESQLKSCQAPISKYIESCQEYEALLTCLTMLNTPNDILLETLKKYEQDTTL